MLFGREAGGWLPPVFDAAAAAAFSPLAALAGRDRKRTLPPMLGFVGDNDTVVPPGQQKRYAEAYRAAGGDFALLEFAGGDHGDGGVNAAAGRDALLDFFRDVGVIPRADPRGGDDAGGHVDRAKRALGLDFAEYPRGVFKYGTHRRATVRLEPLPP